MTNEEAIALARARAAERVEKFTKAWQSNPNIARMAAAGELSERARTAAIEAAKPYWDAYEEIAARNPKGVKIGSQDHQDMTALKLAAENVFRKTIEQHGVKYIDSDAGQVSHESADPPFVWDLLPLANRAWPNQRAETDAPAGGRFTLGKRKAPRATGPWAKGDGGHLTIKREMYRPAPEDLAILRDAFPDQDPENPSWANIEAELIVAGRAKSELVELNAPTLLRLLAKAKGADSQAGESSRTSSKGAAGTGQGMDGPTQSNIADRITAPPEMLEPAVAEMLRRIPETWQTYTPDDLTETQAQALFLLTAAGVVERRERMRVRFADHPVIAEATITSTGEYGGVEALQALFANLWPDWKDAFTQWRQSEAASVLPAHCERLEPSEWRLTDQGVIARNDLDAPPQAADMPTPRQVVFDFVLRRGFFKSREPVRGVGALVKMSKVKDDTPPAGVNIGNWSEGGDAFAQAFGPMMAKMFEAMQQSQTKTEQAKAPNAAPTEADPKYQNWPYAYGSDLHWLWAWSERIDQWMIEGTLPNRHLQGIFKPDQLADQAITRLSDKHPQAFGLIQADLCDIQAAFDGQDSSDAMQDDLLAGMIRLRDRIRTVAKMVADGDADETASQRDDCKAIPQSGMTWQKAMKLAEEHVKAHDGAFPSIKRLAEIVGCSRPTMTKAIGKSSYLKARKAEKAQSARIEPLTDISIEQVSEQAWRDDAAEQPSRDTELDKLIAEQKADQAREDRQGKAAKKRRP